MSRNFLPIAFLALLPFSAACAQRSSVQSDTTRAVDHATMTAEQHAAMHPSASSTLPQSDSAFAALQARGKMAMGVDQYQSAHRFDLLPNGGRISLEMNGDDSLSVAQIRAHLKLIEHGFEAGEFSTPAFVHMRAMPGTEVMARKKSAIHYSYRDLPRGGAVTITTADPEALAAIKQFLAAQRGDHRAGGKGNPAH